jgi:hypothetical protein
MTDALDTFISQRKIEPQIAIKMLAHFDRVVAEVLNEKIKARMSFKVPRPEIYASDVGAREPCVCETDFSMSAGPFGYVPIL